MSKIHTSKHLRTILTTIFIGFGIVASQAQHQFSVDAEGTDYYIKFSATGIWKNHCDCKANNTKIYASKTSFGGSDKWFTGSISGSSTSYTYNHVVGPSSGYKYYYIRVNYSGEKKWGGACVFTSSCSRNVDANGVIATRTSAIKKPKNVQATDEVDDTYIDITWEKGTDIPDNKHQYKIYRDLTEIATVNGDVRTYRDSGLKPGRSYTYRVTTFTNQFSSGNHESSKYGSGAYDDGSTFSMGLRASDSEYTNRTLLRWNDVSDKADEIEVSRIDGTDTVQMDVVSKYSKSFSDYDGIPGYQYTYMVRPVKVGTIYESDFDNGTMKENGRIKGKVVSPLNAGVSGVVVYGEATVDVNGTTFKKLYTDTTDASGYYELTDLYYYKKGDFKLYPGKIKHAFTPDTIERSLDIDNPKLASVDFTDTTVFTVNGKVGYPIVTGASTASCGIQGAKVMLNGNTIAQTDALGNYSFVVQDEGTYNISVEYLHHQFNVNDTNIFIADNVLGLDFIDTETDTLKIKVQGGCNTSLADSVEIRIRATQDQACFDKKVYTNASGNYEIVLPAQEYKVEVTDLFPVNSNIFYQIGNKPITIDLTVRDSSVMYDTIHTVDTITTQIIVLPDGSKDTIPGYYDTTATSYDSSKHAISPKTDFIYRAPISITVNWDDAAEKMVCMPKDGGGTELVPLMETGGRYGLTIDVMEASSGCPVKEGDLRIYDYVSDRDKKAQVLPIVDGRAEYLVDAGVPKIAGGGKHPNQKLFYMLADVGFLDPVPYEEWVLVTGSQARDKTFTTRSAGIPFVVLHDPPGDQSYSYIEKGATFSSFTRTESVFGGYGGIKVEAAAGGGMKTPFSSSKVGWAADLEITAGRDNNWKAGTVTTMTFRERFTTSDAELMTGYPGDVFVGAAYNMIYSLADAINYDDASCGIVRDTILLMDPVGFATTFIYTEDFLKSVLIPNLKELKKLAPADSAAVLQLDIDNWTTILADNAKNRDEDAEQISDDEGFSNISISSGTAYENEYTYDTTVSGSYEYQTFINTDVFLGMAGENLSGFWAKFKAGVVANIKHTYTNETGQDTTRSRVVGYHIEDNDRGDYHSIDILKDKANGVPAFRLVSGATSCPHEPNTQRRYLAEIEVYPPERTNVPSDGKANFTVSLMNNSQSDETQTYQIQVLQESNVDGAVVRLAGTSINHSPVSFSLPPRQLVQVKLTVERGPLASSYKGLKLRIAAGCEVDGLFTLVSADTVSFDVGFQSDCSTVGLYRPVENWIMNSTHGDYLDVAFTNYDANDPNLESLILEYRKEGKGWQEAVEISKDSLIQKFYDVKVLTKNWTDGLYQLRAMANCRSTISQVQYSEIVNGKIDRAPVALFGVPYPSDGILNVGDDIMVEFDQYIDKSISYLPGGFALQRDDDKTFLPISYTINEGKLIIMTKPTSLLDSLEGVKINAIVSNIEDLSGNVLAEPIVWSFVVNRSPVYWTKRNVDYSMERGSSGSFEATLTNVGGVDASFTITDYPDWLVPSTLAGTVSGLGGTTDVTFGVKPGLFPGTYMDTVVAVSGSYKLLLLVKVEVLATAPSWVTNAFDASKFKYNMNAILQFSTDDSDDSLSTDVRDVIGVFKGNELVGKGAIQYMPGLRRYLAFVTIYSDSADSDSLNFRIWDATPGVHYLAKETTIFKNNTLLGQSQSPYILHPNGVYQTLRFNKGWNWFSLYVNTNTSAPDDLFRDLSKDSLTVIKNRDNYAQYHTTGWSNEITNLDEGLGYMIHVPQNDTIEVYGSITDNGTIQVAGNGNWSWVGSGDALGSTIASKVKDLKQSDGDIIKSQTEFAVYDAASTSWIGSLNYLEPGDGYKIKTTIPGAIKTKKLFKTLPPWDMDYNGFEYNMNVTAELVKNNKRIDDSHYLIGAFVDGKCHGVGQPKYSDVLGRFIIYLTAFGDTSNIGKSIELKLYDTDLGQEVGVMHAPISFATDGILGTIGNPLEVDLGNVSVEDLSFNTNQMSCFPNPFDESFTVAINANGTKSNIWLTDLTGRKVQQIYTGVLPASSKFTIQTEDLASGLYFCVAVIDGVKTTQKIVKE